MRNTGVQKSLAELFSMNGHVTPGQSWHGWLMVISAGRTAQAGFHVTQLEITAAGACAGCVAAAIAVGAFYSTIRHRRIAADKFAQARAAKDLQDVLSAFQLAAGDADRELARLAKFRRDNGISSSRELRLSRWSFAGDKRLAEEHRRHLRSFDDACRAALERIAAIDKLLPLAVKHDADILAPDVVQALDLAKSSFRRIRKGRKISLAETRRLITSIKADFPGQGSPGQSGRPVSP
jgi:hypothetical protein